MSDLSLFFAQNAEVETIEDFPVSPRFKDKDGKVVKWQLRSISEEENQVLKKAATKKVKGKYGQYTPETNTDDYLAKLISSTVTYPDLKNAELQKSYGVLGAEALLRKMLLPGEYSGLMEQVQILNGFNLDINDQIAEIKN